MQNDKMDAKAERQEFAKRQEFERLVRENQSGLLAFLLSLTGNLPDSEDLVQECITWLHYSTEMSNFNVYKGKGVSNRPYRRHLRLR